MSQLRKNKGKKGEEQAAKFLQMLGWELLEQNYRHGRGEIDLIFLENDRILVFVEVKTRKNAKFGFAEDNISPAQQVKIYEAAENYIYAINWQGDIRFDVLAIVESSGEIHHAKDAFYL
jgi:putative endonuclease